MASTSACCSGVKRSCGIGGSRIGAMVLPGFARGFGLLDFAVLDFDGLNFDMLDLNFVGADLAGISIPELDLFWPSFNPYTVVDDRGGLHGEQRTISWTRSTNWRRSASCS